MNKKLRIVFLGTPHFAVESLDILVKNNYNIVRVVTAPDSQSGRGLEVHQSPVKEYAIAHGLKVIQPLKLKEESFIKELKSLKADLQIVVAFRMLPESVWNMPPLGTFNLHASLLPQYRGAAPVNWAVINGEKETGVTTFFLQHEIDTGAILFQKKVPITEDETAGELHDVLMVTGAELGVKTVEAIETKSYNPIPQDTFEKDEQKLHKAPKIFKDDCKIDWNKNIHQIHDFVRGLSPHPAGWTELTSPIGNDYQFKIYRTHKEIYSSNLPLKTILTDYKTHFKVVVDGGFLYITELQASGKKQLKIEDYLRGLRMEGSWKIKE